VNTRSIRDLDLEGRRLFLRVDFNVPLENGVIGNDTRIRAALPTIRHALDAGATCIVIASHLGRPQGQPRPEMSLRPVSTRLSELLKAPVAFANDCIGHNAERAVQSSPPSRVVLLENLRFHPEEEQNDLAFAKALATLADVYVNDAFGAAHRAHASVNAIVRMMPDAAAGLLMQQELRYLSNVLFEPARPFVAILGGAKVSDKIEVINNLIPRVDRLIIGGAMAYTFLKTMEKQVGRSLVDGDKLDAARHILMLAQQHDLDLLLPSDHVVSEKVEADVSIETLSVEDAAIGTRIGLDIGPLTTAAYTAALTDAKTVLWNGPMGVFEIDEFALGTIAIAEAVAQVNGTTVVGGGDSIAAVTKAGVTDRITHLSTGGGASLEFLGGRTLPGVTVLPDA